MRAPFFVTAAAGTADLLAAELAALGIEGAREVQGGVACEGELASAYRACLESRLALRVLWQIARFPVADAAALYAGVGAVDWAAHMDASGTLVVDFSGAVPGITHTQFGAQRVKDAVVDQFRERTGTRPSVDRESPTLRINAHAARGNLTLAIDLSGESLHRRGYRGGAGAAPLKENLAAAILIRSGWPAIAAAGGSFVDPMCGSGTLPIEAALIAADIAPGLLRRRLRLRALEAARRRRLGGAARAAAEARTQVGLLTPGASAASTAIPVAIRDAEANAARAGPRQAALLPALRAREAAGRAGADRDSFAVNPPYGERLGETEELRALYALLGERLRAGYLGWEAAVFTGNPALGRELGINARRTHRMMNGADRVPAASAARRARGVRCSPREPGRPPVIDAEVRARAAGRADVREPPEEEPRPAGAWADARAGLVLPPVRRGHARIRLRDRPLPVGPRGQRGPLALRAGVRAARDGRARTGASARREEAISRRCRKSRASLPTRSTGARAGRRRARRSTRSVAEVDERGLVEEGGLKFLRELHRLPRHRPVPRPPPDARADCASSPTGKRFLNLFCYTGAATVYAAAGGAPSTTTVDMSRTYLDWAQRNLAVNGFAGRRASSSSRPTASRGSRGSARAERYDLIFLDPPTFSNRKRMEATSTCSATTWTSSRRRRAARTGRQAGVLDQLAEVQARRRGDAGLEIKDITKGTVPFDFARDAKVHACFEIRRV